MDNYQLKQFNDQGLIRVTMLGYQSADKYGI